MTCPRHVARRRAEALSRAIAEIEAEFGELTGMLLNPDNEISIPLGDAFFHGFPPDMLASEVSLEPWEIMCLLRELHDRYTDEVLGPSEAA